MATFKGETMPKIFGTSLLGILAATIVFYLVGFVWYGVIFADAWMAAQGITEEAAMARNAELGVMMWVWGLVITLMQVIGLSYVLQQSSASVLMTCAKIGAVIAVLFALPFSMYSWLYAGTSHELILIDFSHLLVGFVLACVVLSFFRGKDAVGES